MSRVLQAVMIVAIAVLLTGQTWLPSHQGSNAGSICHAVHNHHKSGMPSTPGPMAGGDGAPMGAAAQQLCCHLAEAVSTVHFSAHPVLTVPVAVKYREIAPRADEPIRLSYVVQITPD